MRPPKSRRASGNAVAGYVFVAPFIIGLFAFTIIPFFSSLYSGGAWDGKRMSEQITPPLRV